jgi:epsilon-lactone hydrolase
VARYSYVVLTRAVPGREAEFDRWYDERHLADVLRIPGIISARRFNLVYQKTTNLEAPPWRSLAIYEIEADDPQAVMNAISSVSGTEVMPLTEALNKDGMIQLIAEPSRSIG